MTEETKIIHDIIDCTRLHSLVWRSATHNHEHYYYTYHNDCQFRLHRNRSGMLYLTVIYGDHPWQQYNIYDVQHYEYYNTEAGLVHRLMFIVNMLFNISLN